MRPCTGAVAVKNAVHVLPNTPQAAEDLNQFMNNEAFTADAAALAKVFKSSTHEASGYATEKQTQSRTP